MTLMMIIIVLWRRCALMNQILSAATGWRATTSQRLLNPIIGPRVVAAAAGGGAAVRLGCCWRRRSCWCRLRRRMGSGADEATRRPTALEVLGGHPPTDLHRPFGPGLLRQQRQVPLPSSNRSASRHRLAVGCSQSLASHSIYI